MAEAVNPTVEDEYWRAHYDTRPYVSPGTKYDEYRPAFQYGWESYARYQGRRFDDVEVELRRDWESRPAAPLGWERVRMAARDAWQRVEGDAPRDGEKRRP
jgi:hypothetical protein